MSKLAPIVLFTYNRLYETKKTVEALQKNFLANESELYIFSDGPKNIEGKEKVDAVLNYLHTINGFKKVQIKESPLNKGLANSIIDGVTEIIDQYGNVIVLEDDLITSPNFLDFMNQALDFYKNDSNIISISGYTLDLPSLPGLKDFYFGYRASSWGWATWKNTWDKVDWEMKNYERFLNDSVQKKQFNFGGSDMVKMLKSQKERRIDSWAIRFCFHQFNNKLKAVFPTSSKINSIGFSKDATHTVNTKRFHTPLDIIIKREFNFDAFSKMDENLVKEFKSKFSIKTRAFDKLKRMARK